ncbi:PAS domain S-box protein [Pyxidicoccus fallax]|uniref:histidine kinase n=1 Tax=Pyxidicoccus fallax TaxID=394095 RepID=A0A848LL71_9BACT|nr:PAS domain S-box protein [Pyxidicoccus fallax]NPC78908.1 PAS domain S-box protein [Pyxidicoccus fallax]
MASPSEPFTHSSPGPFATPGASGVPGEVLEQLTESVAIFSPEGRFQYVNGAAERLLGASRGELVGRLPADMLPGGEGVLLREALSRVAATGRAERFEHHAARTRRWWDARIQPGGDALWFVATDITERKQAEGSPEADLTRLRVLAEASRALSAARLDLGEVLQALTQQVVAHLADTCTVSLASEDGQWVDPVAHHDVDREQKAAYLEMSARARVRMGEGLTGAVAKSGQPLCLAEVSREEVARAVKPEYRHLLAFAESYSVLVVPFSHQGRVIGVLQCARRAPRPGFDAEDTNLLQELADRAAFAITHARLHEQAVLQARVLESMAEGVSVSDESGTIIYTNPAEDRMFGYAAGELVGQHVTAQNAYPPEENARLVGDVITWLKARGSWSGEWRNLRKDGTSIVTRAHITGLELRGRTHWVCVQQDITAEKQVEAERAALLEAEREARARAERTAEYARRLQQVMQLLGQALSAAEVAGAVLDVGVDALDGANAGIWLLDEPGERLELMRHRGFSSQTLEGFRSFPVTAAMPVAEAVRSGQPLWLRNWAEYAEREPAAEAHAHVVRYRTEMAAACLPLLVEGRVIGGMSFGFRGARVLEDGERWFLQILTQHAAQALERVRLFEEQLVTRARLEAVVSASPAAIILLDFDGTVRLWNAAAESIFGWSAQEVLGRPNPMVQEEAREEFVEFLARLERGEVLQGLEVRRQTKARGIIDVELYAAPVRMRDGRTQCLGVMTDITERKRSEARTRFLAEASTLLSSSLDYEQTLSSVAHVAVPTLADWCAVDVLEPDGMVRRVVVTHQDPARVRAALDFHERYPPTLDAAGGLGKVLRTGEPLFLRHLPEEQVLASIEDPVQREALRALGIRSVIIVPLRSRGRVIAGLTLVYADSDRRYTEADLRLAEELALRAATAMDNASLYREAQEAVAARDTFLGVASHELNTPLTSLKLNLQSLQRAVEKLPAEAVPREGLGAKFQSVHRQVGRLASLIRELLDISRITAGKLKLEPEPLDLAEMAREAASRAAEDAAKAGCELRLSVPGPVEGTWDRLRLDQVLQNLLSNALKYGHGRPVDMELEEDGDTVTLRVRDRGIGIAPEDQSRLFQKFQRVASERHYSGFGLGLWIVKQVLDAMGGTIRVESALGQGATFTVTLPRRVPASA